MARRDLGELGPGEGPPVEFTWRWFYNLPSLPLWIALVVLLLVPRANRSRQAWLILVLPLPLAAFWQVLRLALGPSYPLESIELWTTSLAIAWACVWLLAPWLGGAGLARARRRALGVMAGMGVLTYVGYFGLWFSPKTSLPVVCLWASMAVPLVVATAISARRRRAAQSRPALGWLVLWLFVLVEACLILLVLPAIGIPGRFDSVEFVVASLSQSPLIAGVLTIFLFFLNLPVMLLCSHSSCYGERLEAMFPAATRPPTVEPPATWTTPATWTMSTAPGAPTDGENPFA